MATSHVAPRTGGAEPSSPAPLVSVVLLTYNRRPLLARCLERLSRQTHPALEIIVVDNASPDDTSEFVRATFPSVRLITNAENLYFTGGMNRGIKAARGEFILLLTDDVLLEPDYVARLLPVLADDPRVGLATGIIYDEDTGDVVCAGGEIRFGIDRARVTVYRPLPPAAPDGSPRRVVGYAPPTLALTRRQVLEAVEAFDDDFKFTGEDFDLALKLRLRGYQIVVDIDAAGHYMRPLSNRDRESAILEFHIQKNVFLLYFKHAPLATLVGFLVYRAAWLTKQYTLSKLGKRPPLTRGALQAHRWWIAELPRLIEKRLRLRRLVAAPVTSG
jgi:GT2 family glycosyltransferase